MACWFSYDSAKGAGKHPQELGKGSIAGICALESSHNTATEGSFILLLTLGVPGSSTAAVILGGMMIHGLTPGNSLFMKKDDIVYLIVVGFIIANILMGVVGVLIGPFLAKLVNVPASSLAPVFLALCIYRSLHYQKQYV